VMSEVIPMVEPADLEEWSLNDPPPPYLSTPQNSPRKRTPRRRPVGGGTSSSPGPSTPRSRTPVQFSSPQSGCSDIYQELLSCLKNESPGGQSSQTPPPVARSNTWDECSLCFEDMGDYVLFPCGHAGMCKKCAEQLTRCSQCRTEITGRTRIYRS